MKFSVIVPIYNVEAYLPACIESILRQDEPDFELILVNDGSTDGCKAIAQSYAEKDSRVQVINQENGGLVFARKAGAEKATGDYVICVDGDDFIDQGYFSFLSTIIRQNHPDVIAVSIIDDCEGQIGIRRNAALPGVYDAQGVAIIRNAFIHDENAAGFVNAGSLHYTLWSKAFRREIYLPAQMAVPNHIRLGEDLLCTYAVLKQAKSIVVCDEAFYHYRILPQSMSHIVEAKQLTRAAETVAELDKLPGVSNSQKGAFAFHSLYNKLFGMALQFADRQGFVQFAKENRAVEDLHAHIETWHPKNTNPKERLKLWLFAKKKYSLVYCIAWLKNKTACGKI